MDSLSVIGHTHKFNKMKPERGDVVLGFGIDPVFSDMSSFVVPETAIIGKEKLLYCPQESIPSSE